jgi:cystathionine beta-lyase/cystathionine gamma-synthase
VTTPIFTSTSHRFPNPAGGEICYPRYMNIPTQKAAADKVAALEHAEAGLVVSSGMAAIVTSIMTFVRAGDHVVFQADLYGGTHHFITAELARFGVQYTLVSGSSPADLAAALEENTRIVYLESPSNPLLKVIDLEETVALLRGRNVLTMIDNTFATPVNQTPLDFGFDVSIHSGTKYLNGHSDLNCGAIAASRKHVRAIQETAVNFGFTLNVYDCYLLERSMKTLGVRVARHNENALALARFLGDHPRVSRVHYPGLPDHEGHEIAKKQMEGFGGMMSFELDASAEEAVAIIGRLKLITQAVSLGGVESLVCFPACTSHVKISREERLAIGVTDSLVRFSVGIEDVEDLIADLSQALEG